MTILSKKKPPTKAEENGEASHQNTHNHSVSLNSGQIYNQNREKSMDDCYSTGVTAQLDSLENDVGKHRVRVSPSRVTRNNKLRERGTVGSSWSSSASISGNSSPKPGPSTAPDVSDEDCNSEDEHVGRGTTYTEAEWLERDRLFEKRMAKGGFEIRKMKEDGACLFRSVSDQVYGDQEMHDVVRKHCMDYIAANRDYYSQYMTEDFNKYINRKRQGGTHGNHIEIQAMCEMYNRPIEVFCYSKDPINIFHGSRDSPNTNDPIRLSYQRDSHYNSIVDPYKATIGVGLGLPNYSPGSADRNLMKDAIRQSEQLEIEQTMLQDKLRATDWEATNEAIEKQVARESYLQWFKENESRKKSVAGKSPKETTHSSSPTTTKSEAEETKPDEVTEKSETTETNAKPADGFNFDRNASFFDNFPPELFGIHDLDDFGILSQVLATSQEEYLESLKLQQKQGKEDNKSQ